MAVSLTLQHVLFPIVLAVIAAANIAVGQAGATGYIAAMGLVGFRPDVIRPAALTPCVPDMLTFVTALVTLPRISLGRDVSGCDPTYGASAAPAGGLAHRT